MKVLVAHLELLDRTLLVEISKERRKAQGHCPAFGQWRMEENLRNSAGSPRPFFLKAHQPGAILGETIIQGSPYRCGWCPFEQLGPCCISRESSTACPS